MAKDLDDIAQAAQLFNGFADRTRLAILVQLSGGELRVKDLVDVLDGSQGNVSGHLRCLKDCGLVAHRPEGRQMFYRIARPEVVSVLRSVEVLLKIAGPAIDLCPNYQPKP